MQRSRVTAWVFGLGLSACTTHAPAPRAPSVNEVAAELVSVDRYPRREVVFADGVRGLPDQVYASEVGYRPLRLDLYLPPRAVTPPAAGHPLVVYIHGGGWMVGDTRRNGAFLDFPGVLASLAARGYVVASVEYRLASEARFPAQAHDVKAAIRWLRRHAREFGIDPTRALTWGESAGGHLAALLALSCECSALAPPASMGAPLQGVSDCVQGAVAWFGVFDFATFAAQARVDPAMSRQGRSAPEWPVLGCFAEECKPEDVRAASPVSYVDGRDPPLLLLVGADDRIVPKAQTLQLAERLAAHGVAHEVEVLPGVDHNFIGQRPEQTREANLRALAATFRFIDQTFGRAARAGTRR